MSFVKKIKSISSMSDLSNDEFNDKPCSSSNETIDELTDTVTIYVKDDPKFKKSLKCSNKLSDAVSYSQLSNIIKMNEKCNICRKEFIPNMLLNSQFNNMLFLNLCDDCNL